jgi:hypothetical protein
MKVELINTYASDGAVYTHSLTPGRLYEVIGIAGDCFHLVADDGEPVLYEAASFRVVEASEPPIWTSEFVDGERYAYPEEWNKPGFFEDWHDNVPGVRDTFARQLQEWFPDIQSPFKTA